MLRAVTALATALLIIAAKEPEPRRIAVRLSEGISSPAALESLAERAKGRGIELQVAPEGTSVPRGFDVAHLAILPPPEALRAALARLRSIGVTDFIASGPDEQTLALLASEL